jgi:hypothetical protein
MLDRLAPGDVVTVTRIDRLARSTFDLFAIVKRIVDAGGQFRSLAEPWADTGTSTGRLMLAVLGGLADVERDLIRTRTAEGRSRATAASPPQHGSEPFTAPTHRAARIVNAEQRLRLRASPGDGRGFLVTDHKYAGASCARAGEGAAGGKLSFITRSTIRTAATATDTAVRFAIFAG